MANLAWAFAISGGAAVLGAAIAFGMFKDHPRRTVFALLGAALALFVGVGISFIVSGLSQTAPSNAPDRSGSQYDTPARPSDQNALPGLNQPNR